MLLAQNEWGVDLEISSLLLSIGPQSGIVNLKAWKRITKHLLLLLLSFSLFISMLLAQNEWGVDLEISSLLLSKHHLLLLLLLLLSSYYIAYTPAFYQKDLKKIKNNNLLVCWKLYVLSLSLSPPS